MIKAVVYTSNSGYTAKYAAMAAQKLGVPAYTLAEAKTSLSKGDDVLYLGWLMAGIIQGLKKAKRYSVLAVCGVGMAKATDNERARIAKQNKLPIEKFFLLQGGFDITKLHGVYHFMMSAMVKAMGKGIGDKVAAGTATEEEKEMLEMAQNGKDCTSEDALLPVLAYVQK